MLYRDLIPGRLGGRYIASHITIPEGGPVADWVHYHRVAFQMIYVRRGWVRVVYEDQGEPFVMHAGDLVLQPPEIRHRVLESSPGLEVIEIGCPALHETLADHELELPNGASIRAATSAASASCVTSRRTRPGRRVNGGEAQETASRARRAGLAEVADRYGPARRSASRSRRTTASWCSASSSTARRRSNTASMHALGAGRRIRHSARAKPWSLARRACARLPPAARHHRSGCD